MLHGLVPEILLPNSSDTFLPPAWSISSEWQFYLVAPALIWLFKYSPPKLPLVITFGSYLVVLIGPLHWRLYAYWDHMGGFLGQKFYLFMSGALLYHYWPSFGNKWGAPRELRWLGKISYSTYLVHFPILAVLNAWLDWRTGQCGRTLIMAIAATPVIVALSALFYYQIEKPGITFGKALTKARSL
jgi:peptidoglycan/LPS O-acetylase OafA/YrhL